MRKISSLASEGKPLLAFIHFRLTVKLNSSYVKEINKLID